MVPPEHTAWLVPGTGTAAGYTLTTTVSRAKQPLAVVASSTYCWVRVALVRLGRVTVGFSTAALLRPVAGLQA